jgi:OFA family oxalate/formate antiporter-like MFS transporter
MPAFAADFFGAKDFGSIYGIMLTAWGAAALFGPTLIATPKARVTTLCTDGSDGRLS